MRKNILISEKIANVSEVKNSEATTEIKVKECLHCKGTGYCDLNYYGPFLPYQLWKPYHQKTNKLMNRPRTNGIHQLEEVYLEDIVIDKIGFNKTQKKIFMHIGF